MKKFLNETVFSNFIHAITSTKFFADSATKTTIPNLNNLKMIDVLNSIIFASSALVQMSRNVVENSNPLKHFSLARLNESVKIGWKVMTSFITGFDSLIVFYSSFCFFFSFFSDFFRQSTLSRLITPPQGGRTKKESEKEVVAVFFFWTEMFLNSTIL